MQCRQCKKEVDLGSWRFCPHCGNGLKDEIIFNFFRKLFSRKRNIFILIILELFFIGTIISLYLIYQNKLEEKNQKIMDLAQKSREIKIEWKAEDEILPLTYANDNKKLVELRIMSPIYGKIKTEIEVPGVINKEVKILDVKPESKVVYLNPDITEEGYRNLNDSHRFQLNLKVSQVEEDATERIILNEDKEIFFFARNDMIWNDDGVNNANYVVRLINKDRDEIKELLRKSAEHMIDVGGSQKAMVGFLGDEKEIQRQLEAIFTAIQKDYKIRYVASIFSYDAVDVQRIKSPEEVLKTQSGLCIELALLVAAALENIGLNSIIIVTEAHAWVGVELDPMSDRFIFLETTALDKDPKEAIDIAQKNWDLIKKTPTYKILRVNNLRAEGLLPIKF